MVVGRNASPAALQEEVIADRPWWQEPLQASVADGGSNGMQNAAIPASCDVAIIGSGIAGAATAYWLLKADPSCSVVVLERGLTPAWGATGRNGGQLLPFVADWQSFVQRVGKEDAERRRAIEQSAIPMVREFCRKHGADCELRQNGTLLLCNDQEVFDGLQRDAQAQGFCEIWDAERCHVELGDCASTYAGGVLWPIGGQLWAAKLCEALLQAAVQLGAVTRTGCEVSEIRSCGNGAGDGGSSAELLTSLGLLHARRCTVVCTNGYAAELLPELQDFVKPVRGQVLLTAPIAEKHRKPWNIITYAPATKPGQAYGSSEYLIQRADGRVVFGGARHVVAGSEVGVKDDSRVRCDIATRLRALLFRLGFPEEAVQVERDWSGVMGYTTDGAPVLGPLPGRPGVLACLGFTGHGMPQAFPVARAVAEMALSADGAAAPDWLPPSWLAERLTSIIPTLESSPAKVKPAVIDGKPGATGVKDAASERFIAA